MAQDACRVPLGDSGLFALVDAADYERVAVHKWHLKRKKSQPGKFYAQRTVRLGSGRGARKTSIMLHHAVAGHSPGTLIDHRNGDGLDNRRENLRVANKRQNSENVTLSKNQRLGGYKGVSWNKKGKRWEAHIGAGEIAGNGKRRHIYLGLFSTAEAAARAYDAAAKEHFGEWASLNFPESLVEKSA